MGDGRTCTREGKREASLKREGHVEPHRIRRELCKRHSRQDTQQIEMLWGRKRLGMFQ